MGEEENAGMIGQKRDWERTRGGAEKRRERDEGEAGEESGEEVGVAKDTKLGKECVELVAGGSAPTTGEAMREVEDGGRSVGVRRH